ncbi:MAG: acyl carrier protein [Deltaproteobacteria bacterium]|nr:acyl carrier protein [Deltaproteobacteria bacterium]
MDIERRVMEIVGGVLGMPVENVRLEARLADDLGATSLDRYTILMDIEDAFELDLDEVPEEELEGKIATVGDIVEMLRAHLDSAK